MSEPERESVTILLNGQEVQADPTKPLIHACMQAGQDVPHYCYHPGLSPVGSCRMCQVEVKQGDMPARVVVACRTPVAPGMQFDTDAPEAHAARRECLEFLLKNHPLDCPICDKAGECTLQDYSFDEGQGSSRSVEPRRKLEKRKDLGDVILLDQERCILCSRCVRFMDEVPKTPQLVISQRGADSVIETWRDRPLTGNYQGNLADVCPVGALTLKPFRFRARVWNLHKVAATCGECSRGCSITVEVLRKGEVKRIRPRFNEQVNGYWMCDHGRFALDELNPSERLIGGRLRSETRGWDAVAVEDALATARDMLVTHGATLIVASPFLTVEDGRQLLALCKTLSARLVFVSPEPSDLADDLLHTGDPCPNRRGLTDLGFEGLSPAGILQALGEVESALLVGERLGALLSARPRADDPDPGDAAPLDPVGEGLAGLPTSLRTILLGCEPIEAAAIGVAVGIPNQVERAGTWINVDGIEGCIAPARPAPAGVWTTARVLDTLHTLLTTQFEATAGEVTTP